MLKMLKSVFQCLWTSRLCLMQANHFEPGWRRTKTNGLESTANTAPVLRTGSNLPLAPPSPANPTWTIISLQQSQALGHHPAPYTLRKNPGAKTRSRSRSDSRWFRITGESQHDNKSLSASHQVPINLWRRCGVFECSVIWWGAGWRFWRGSRFRAEGDAVDAPLKGRGQFLARSKRRRLPLGWLCLCVCVCVRGCDKTLVYGGLFLVLPIYWHVWQSHNWRSISIAFRWWGPK